MIAIQKNLIIQRLEHRALFCPIVTKGLTVSCSEDEMRKTTLVSAATALLLAAASASWAGPIEDRQELMKQQGQSTKVLGTMAQGESPFDAAAAKEHGDAMAERFERAKTLFPPGTEQGPPETYAKAEIWSDPQGFAAAADQAIEAARAVAAVTEEAQLGEAVGALGNACKNCHDKFRRPKD
jgi:cytochrome c556